MFVRLFTCLFSAFFSPIIEFNQIVENQCVDDSANFSLADNNSTSFYEVEKAQIDCRRRKRKTKGCLEYELFETENNYSLYNDLVNRSYEILPSDAFIVDYPCPREVFAGQYRDRNVHHLVINRKNKYFERTFIDSSYSCRVGKGTLYGIQDAYKQLSAASHNFTKEVYIVKGDLTSCFMRVSKPTLMDQVESILIGDWENWIFRKIIFNKPQDYCILKSPKEKWIGFPKHKSLFGTDGMPIGNLTSQILVNFYLSPYDKWAQSYDGILGYGRYVDDFFAIFGTYEEARQFMAASQIELEKYNMILHPTKIKIISSTIGFEFIGAYIKPGRIYATKRTISKFSSSLYEKQHLSITEWFGTINSYLGYLSQFKAYRIKYKVINHFQFLHEYGYFNVDLTKFIPYKEYQHLVGCNKSKYTKYEYQAFGHYFQWHQEVKRRCIGLTDVEVAQTTIIK